MGAQRLTNDLRHRHARIQRRQWVLEDHLHGPAFGLPSLRTGTPHFVSMPNDATVGEGHEIEQCAGQRGLATTRLTHNAQCFAGTQFKRHTVHRLEHTRC